MILLNGLTIIDESEEIKLKSGVTVTAEGLAIVQDTENGLEVGKLSSGSSDKFLGFSYGRTMTPVTKSKVESLVVPSSGTYTVTLDKEPISGQIFITNGTTVQTSGTPATTANEYSISGKVITFHSGQAGLTETITYRYSPTALELFQNDRLDIDSVSGSDLIGQIGIIKHGKVFTDQFNAGGTWVMGAALSMAASGILTTGTGNTLTGGVVCHVPTVDLPFLGVRF